MAKPKQFIRPPKKSKGKLTEPQTADDFQELADAEEETGGKWRAGDKQKSGRAYVRALDIYDKGLEKHPQSFDLAYNKARLMLEITQRPALVDHIGLPLEQLLQQALHSHRYALRLNEENADILFNTAQVLISLAEYISSNGDESSAITALEEAIELLSSCLSRQEMLFEQQQVDLEDAEDGGVALDPGERMTSAPGSPVSEQTATIEHPVTPNDLLDTVAASLSALTTLAPLIDPNSLGMLGDLAQSLTEVKAPSYISTMPVEEQDAARFATALQRANFLAAHADAQYTALMIDVEAYLSILDAFNFPAKSDNAYSLRSEASAKTEMVLSVLTRFENALQDAPAQLCWSQLRLSQDLYGQAAKLEPSAELYMSRGDVDLLRHRLASNAKIDLSASIQRSAPTLANNAQTYYKGACKLADREEDTEMSPKALRRLYVASSICRRLHGVESSAEVSDALETVVNDPEAKSTAFRECVEEGLLETGLAEQLARDEGLG